MKKKIISLTCAALAVGILLVGCGLSGNSVETPGIKVDKDLAVEAVIIDDFDESQYDLNELQTMVNKEADEYNSSGQAGAITPVEVSVTEGQVKVIIDYADADAYSGFNGRYFKIMTIDEALTEGIPSISFKSVKDASLMDPRTLAGDETYHMCVTDETGDIKLPGKVQYISDGVETITKNSVKVTENMDGLAYIIFTNK